MFRKVAETNESLLFPVPVANDPGRPREDREGLEQAWDKAERDQLRPTRTKQDEIGLNKKVTERDEQVAKKEKALEKRGRSRRDWDSLEGDWERLEQD